VEEEEVLFSVICNRLAAGTPLMQIVGEGGMPSWTTFNRWSERSPERIAEYTRARQSFADAIADETMTIADGARTMLDKELARLRIDTRKWYAGKIRPKVYGDKIAIGGADDLPPVQTLDVSKLSTEALIQLQEAMGAKPDADER
jgi:hypothetical protein